MDTNGWHVALQLDDATVSMIHDVFDEIATDESIKVVILTGAGEKAFVAGADIQELAGQDSLEARNRALQGQAALAAIEGCGKPVIAMINGFALGGGCELALACHLRYASAKAKLGLPEARPAPRGAPNHLPAAGQGADLGTKK